MFVQDRTQIADFSETSEGFLVLKNSRLARTGVQRYLLRDTPGLSKHFPDHDPESIIRIYRPPSEVFDKASLDSIAGMPVTIDHPKDFVDSGNIHFLTVGQVGDTLERDGDFVKGLVRITHKEGVDAVQKGLVELSVGYDVDIEVKDGITPAGEAYDGIQRNIRGNHVALVSRGRGGISCRVHDRGGSDANFRQETHRMDLKIVDCGGSQVEMTDAAVVALKSLTENHSTAISSRDAKIEGLQQKLKDAEKALATSEAKAESAAGKLKDAEKQLTPDALDTAARERASLVTDAAKLYPDIKCEKLDSVTIKRVALEGAGVNLKDRSEDFIDAAFDARVEIVDADPGTARRTAASLANASTKNTEDNDEPRAAYLKKVSGSYRQEAK